MDVDGEESRQVLIHAITEEDAKQSLHLKITDDFTNALAALVIRVINTDPRLPITGGTSESIYAPRKFQDEPKDQNYSSWSAAQLIAHLERRKSVLPPMTANLGAFLNKPYEARTGGRTAHG
ncbi:hypothetical protein MPER_05869 [Moniliophthora perniciosa FA553]|nr:hypothetical protein MPER_05869 [Moniliophthora perniciosa FA553]